MTCCPAQLDNTKIPLARGEGSKPPGLMGLGPGRWWGPQGSQFRKRRAQLVRGTGRGIGLRVSGFVIAFWRVSRRGGLGQGGVITEPQVIFRLNYSVGVTDTATSSSELTVGQLAARSGVAVSALHFYEAKGLIRSRRTAGNQRRYSRDTLRRVAFIRISQRVGLSLNAIREALAQLPDERTPTRQDWERLSRVWRQELDERIAYLLQLRENLTDCIGCGCLSLDRCALSNPDDVLSREGPGPRNFLSAVAARCERLCGPAGGSDERGGGEGEAG